MTEQSTAPRTLAEIDNDIDYARSDMRRANDDLQSAKARHDKAIAEFDQFNDERVEAVKALVASGDITKAGQWTLLQTERSRYRFLIDIIGADVQAANPALSLNAPGSTFVLNLHAYARQRSHLPLAEALTGLLDAYGVNDGPDAHEEGVSIRLAHRSSYRKPLTMRWLPEEDVATLYAESVTATGIKVGYGGFGDILDEAIDHYEDRKRLA